MATKAKIGMGERVEIGRIDIANSALVTFTTLAEVKDVTLPESSRDEIDVTSMDSNGEREFISGLSDNGEVAFDMNWVIGSTTDALIKSIYTSGETVQVRFKVGPTGTANTFALTETYIGFCKGYTRTSPVGEAKTATATFRISGTVV